MKKVDLHSSNKQHETINENIQPYHVSNYTNKISKDVAQVAAQVKQEELAWLNENQPRKRRGRPVW